MEGVRIQLWESTERGKEGHLAQLHFSLALDFAWEITDGKVSRALALLT